MSGFQHSLETISWTQHWFQHHTPRRRVGLVLAHLEKPINLLPLLPWSEAE